MTNSRRPIRDADIEALMKQCQIGVGGTNALDDAHDIMAHCYATLGALMTQRRRLLALAIKHCPRDHHDFSEISSFLFDEA
jgi:hypothetical protein